MRATTFHTPFVKKQRPLDGDGGVLPWDDASTCTTVYTARLFPPTIPKHWGKRFFDVNESVAHAEAFPRANVRCGDKADVDCKSEKFPEGLPNKHTVTKNAGVVNEGRVLHEPRARAMCDGSAAYFVSNPAAPVGWTAKVFPPVQAMPKHAQAVQSQLRNVHATRTRGALDDGELAHAGNAKVVTSVVVRPVAKAFAEELGDRLQELASDPSKGDLVENDYVVVSPKSPLDSVHGGTLFSNIAAVSSSAAGAA